MSDIKKIAEVCGWTEARTRTFFKSGLRALWSKYPPKFHCLKDAEEPNEGKFPSKARKVFKCAECGRYFPAAMTVKGKRKSLIAVDHIEPAGGFETFEDLPELYKHMFPTKDGLQVLCNYTKDMFEEFGQPSCHYTKTQEERKLAKEKKEKLK